MFEIVRIFEQFGGNCLLFEQFEIDCLNPPLVSPQPQNGNEPVSDSTGALPNGSLEIKNCTLSTTQEEFRMRQPATSCSKSFFFTKKSQKLP